jgi:hypothetical protein
MSLSAELMLKLRLVACCDYIALRGSRDGLVLALAGADWLHRDHQPHQRGARGQAVPRLVGSHGRQSNFRRTVGVALLVSTYRHVSGEGKAARRYGFFYFNSPLRKQSRLVSAVEWLFNRCNLCRLSFVLGQHTAEGHTN